MGPLAGSNLQDGQQVVIGDDVAMVDNTSDSDTGGGTSSDSDSGAGSGDDDGDYTPSSTSDPVIVTEGSDYSETSSSDGGSYDGGSNYYGGSYSSFYSDEGD